MRLRILLILIPLLCTETRALQFIFLPGAIDLPPLTANHQEPRVGLRKETATSRMKVDIGASVEMLEFRIDSTERLRLGIDFFTYALSTNSEGLRLQIDAVDGFFGGHVSYTHGNVESERFSLRLRLLHLSAHFLDGHFSNITQTWKENRSPIPFTRDFGELLALYDAGTDEFRYRLCAGLSYATLIRPINIQRVEALAGFELYSSSLTQTAFGKPCFVYLAYNITLRGIPAYSGSNTVDAGIKFGQWNSTGLRIYVSYFSGLDFYSQYYDVRRENWALGFAFDFW